MFSNSPIFNIDFYKVDHIRQYPKNTVEIYSNFTPRSYIPGDNLPKKFNKKILWLGLQAALIDLKEEWNNWFVKPKSDKILDILEYDYLLQSSLGMMNPNLDHLYKLVDLENLPIAIKSLPEGDLIPLGCPVLTIKNIQDEYFWLTNYLETYLSAQLWKTSTVATIALQYRILFEKYAKQTCEDNSHVVYQGHDFSYRGMSGTDDAARSGIGHLACFKGTDNVPSIMAAKKYYKASNNVGASVPATEHSVMCMGTKEDELNTYRRLLQLYPTGIVSIVSDTWDIYNVLDNILPTLKDDILSRNGKLVIRPDSGDPVTMTLEVIERLANTFGFSTNKKGYKELNPRIGVIYGDSITYARAEKILREMKKRKWASNNVVFGIGSYTYQYLTRDTFGWAMKATCGTILHDGFGYISTPIYKDPVTATNKKSLKGYIIIHKDINGEYFAADKSTIIQSTRGELQTKYIDGLLIEDQSLDSIRNKVDIIVAKELL